MNNLNIIIGREYKERVAKKSFIITTIFVPLLMVALAIVPTLLLMMGGSNEQHYAVVDYSGEIAGKLENTSTVRFSNCAEMDPDSLKSDSRYDGILVIGRDIMTNPSNVQLFSHGASSLDAEKEMQSQIKEAIENIRLTDYNIANLKEILANVEANVSLTTYRLDKEDGEESMSSIVSFGLGIGMAFLLYMFLMIYGQMVMTSIIEEKNNRVLEIIVSSVKPEQLMLGKIIGIGLVAVTQILIWAVITLLLVGMILPALMPAEVASDMAQFNAGTLESTSSIADMKMIQALSVLSDLGFMMHIFIYLTIFLVGGFLLYASIFAAIGSSVDNAQDAQQLTTLAVIPILIGFMCAMTIGNDPNSPLAFWLSIIPLTSPMIMMVRIPFDIPQWEVWLSIILLYGFFLIMVWLAAKIYRVGIFMYGKKPTIKELIKWARYK